MAAGQSARRRRSDSITSDDSIGTQFVGISMGIDLVASLDGLAQERGTKRSGIIRQILSDFFAEESEVEAA